MSILSNIQAWDMFRNMCNDASKSESVSLLRQLVEIESPSFDVSASTRIARELEAHFTARGARVRLVDTEAGTTVIAEVDGWGAPLLLLGHTDTVWPVGTLSGPVPWIEHNGTISGPGVFDMKGGIVVMLLALSLIAGKAHRAIRIVLNCDEEVGSPTTTALLKELGHDASVALGFESPHPDGALKLGRRGSTRLRLTATGRAAHAALDPELGISAIDELVDQLLRVREIVSARDLPSPVLCNVGMIGGGERANVVPDSASAELGLRFIDSQTERRVLHELCNLTPIRPGAHMRAEILSTRAAWLASAGDTALFEGIRTAAITIGQDVGARPASGAGDANLLSSLGLPTIDGFGPRGGGAHASNEHIDVASLRERAELVAAVVTTLTI